MSHKRLVKRATVLLRLEPEELALIDRCRLQLNRSDFIRGAIRLRCEAPSIKAALKMLDTAQQTT